MVTQPDPIRARPQEPAPPFPYLVEEVVYENRGARVILAGTLTTPEEGAPYPAALLITGSGAHDRDESLLGHRPFLVIADHLARHGIAVLRVDDRGVGGSSAESSTGASEEDLAGDARAGVELLKSRADIRSEGIGLIGHSDGGAIAAMVAAGSTDVAWIVLLAGPGVPGNELLLEQADLVAAAMGVREEAREESRRLNRALYAVVKNEPDDDIALKEIEQLISEHVSDIAEAAGIPTDQVLAQMRSQTESLVSPWFRSFLTSDPGQTLRRVAVPVLAMSGELDLQVPPGLNLPAIETALEAGGNRDYTVVQLPRLNHLFQTATTGSPTEYAEIEETFAPAALDLMTGWILHRI